MSSFVYINSKMCSPCGTADVRQKSDKINKKFRSTADSLYLLMLGQCFQTFPSAAYPLDKETPFGNLHAAAVDVPLTQICYKVPKLQIKSSNILKFSEEQQP